MPAASNWLDAGRAQQRDQQRQLLELEAASRRAEHRWKELCSRRQAETARWQGLRAEEERRSQLQLAQSQAKAGGRNQLLREMERLESDFPTIAWGKSIRSLRATTASVLADARRSIAARGDANSFEQQHNQTTLIPIAAECAAPQEPPVSATPEVLPIVAGETPNENDGRPKLSQERSFDSHRFQTAEPKTGAGAKLRWTELLVSRRLSSGPSRSLPNAKSASPKTSRRPGSLQPATPPRRIDPPPSIAVPRSAGKAGALGLLTIVEGPLQDLALAVAVRRRLKELEPAVRERLRNETNQEALIVARIESTKHNDLGQTPERLVDCVFVGSTGSSKEDAVRRYLKSQEGPSITSSAGLTTPANSRDLEKRAQRIRTHDYRDHYFWISNETPTNP